MTESYSPTQTIMRYYGRTNAHGRIIQYGAQVPFFLDFVPQTPVKALYYKQAQNAYTFEKVVRDYIRELPLGKRVIPNWQVSANRASVCSIFFRSQFCRIFQNRHRIMIIHAQQAVMIHNASIYLIYYRKPCQA